ncbi:MAG TPA: hypothetical protein VMU17_04980, partial [Elusimicrobiota bacterium]|nr:hypothetical protein [Elusimicrobiota bacterium]
RKVLQPIIEKAQALEMPIYLVGGCVRDILLGRPSLDVDIVVEGPADALARGVAKDLKAKLVSHPTFLTHTLYFSQSKHLDIAAARTETYAEPAALPAVEAASLQEDLYRRDFSINAMALSLNAEDFGHLWDPFGGVDDLRNGKLRVLHAESFKDDPTRLFRAARFSGRFGYALDWRSREWLLESIEQQLPARLSGARLREELIPILMEDDPRPAFRLLAEWSALTFLIPNLKWEKTHEALFGQIRRPDGDPCNMVLLRLLVLVHNIPYAKAIGSVGHLMFPQKTVGQVEQALQLLARLRQGALSVSDLKGNSGKPLSPEVRAFLEKALRIRAIAPKKDGAQDWARLQESTPCLSGRDIRDLGYKPGPEFSKMFDALRQARWEGKLRTREEEIRFLMQSFPREAS